MHRTTGFSGNPSTVYSKLTSYMTNPANVSAINATGVGVSIADPNMLVNRVTDGSAIKPASNFPY
jgi:hypothetical protein